MSLGIYIHVPFCKSKCAYCDFYSFAPKDEGVKDEYEKRIIEDIKKWAARLNRAADTLYFGGGTPSLLGGERIARIVRCAKESFGLKGAEITVECNPGDDLDEEFRMMALAGVNRISIGAQSANDAELQSIFRRHTALQVKKTVYAAQNAGIRDISLDIMLGIPLQTISSLRQTAAEFAALPVNHISAYILKAEEGTPLSKRVDELPDEDTVSDMYLAVCDELREHGFDRYEISNFGRDGARGRHNMKYWNCEEYLGIGPAAHSFIGGRRFYYERDLAAYMNGAEPVEDGNGGDASEYVMLRLRLEDGLDIDEFAKRFGDSHIEAIKAETEKLVAVGLMKKKGNSYCFTDNGALVSNECIARIIENID